MSKTGNKNDLVQILVVSAFVFAVAQFSQAAEVFHFENGINATIYESNEINTDLITTDKNGVQLVHPAAGTLELIDSSEKWFPMDKMVVVAALKAMSGFATDVDVDVFLLPAPPASTGCSFARRGSIYLAPSKGLVPAEAAANITTHEMGHVLTWAFVDGKSNHWTRYMLLRGLDDNNNGPGAIHADRAREILAEDIRFLFGGELGNYSGGIENHSLVLPNRVEGLQEMLVEFISNNSVGPDLVSSTAFPNPFNPMTTIEMALPSDSGTNEAVLRIYDIRGSLVRTINGGYVANGRVSVQWNGTDNSSNSVASGRYLYIMQVDSAVAKGSLMLVR